jgi:hypothetical protein
VLELASTVFAGVQWRIQPRGDSDITTNPTLGVDDPLPAGVSFAIAPNPARVSHVMFGLPTRQHVKIAVFDLAGRRRAELADAEFPAGRHTLEWNGIGTDGKPVGAGVYFYKLTIGGQTYNTRGVMLD